MRSESLSICWRDELRYSGKAMATTVKSTKANHRPLAVVTGASSGTGYYLAKECAKNGFDLLIAADDPKINDVARDFRALGTVVDAIESDLATTQGRRRARFRNQRPARQRVARQHRT